ncbi:uncharacterized protein LOC9645345 [Selaginella moellendorffii]|uniref:uncharacterized protein LOC9645345 n=1 Tax=Selaginella moellendorffii TaxID=88036 RepID=UPI000D1C8938|nr:uncharacterized protein LOC9645345 [Selaginella moellendorffii]|eukprot:XP_024530347.1 uncharacterized protein LOC9645345 [Selaginella moellendorffii]
MRQWCFLPCCCQGFKIEEEREVVEAGDIIEPCCAAAARTGPAMSAGELESQAIRVVSEILQHQAVSVEEKDHKAPSKSDSLGIDEFDDQIILPSEDDGYEDTFSTTTSLLDLATEENKEGESIPVENVDNAASRVEADPGPVEMNLLLVVALLVLIWWQLYRKSAVASQPWSLANHPTLR